MKILALILVLTVALSAQAGIENVQARAISKVIFESSNTLDSQLRLNQVMAELALVGGSHEDRARIASDLSADLKKIGAKLPDITLATNGAILANSKSTGLRIASYTPFNLSKDGAIWYFKTSLNLQENYRSLQKFFKSSKSIVSGFFLPSALALDELNSFFDGGANTDYVAALSTINGALPKGGGASPAGTLAWLAALTQASRASADNVKSVVKTILNSDFDLQCSQENGVTVSDPSGGHRASIKIGANRKGAQFLGWQLTPDRPGIVSFADGKGRSLPLADQRAFPEDEKSALAFLCSCKDSSQASAIKASIKAALKGLEDSRSNSNDPSSNSKPSSLSKITQ